MIIDDSKVKKEIGDTVMEQSQSMLSNKQNMLGDNQRVSEEETGINFSEHDRE